MVGASLLLLFNTTGNLYPLPAYDFFALEERFNRACVLLTFGVFDQQLMLEIYSGGRLSSMSTSDQATCRIVFALASSLSTEHAIADPSFLSQELAEQAQSFIDFVDISRWSPLDNAINLLLLWQSVCRGEIGSDVGQPFLVAVVEQLSRVHETDPPLLRSPARGFSSCLVYHAMLYDAAAAVERGTKPKFTPLAYHRILDVQEIAMDAPLPSLEDVKVALRSGPWPAVQAIIHAVASYFVASRRLAYFLAALDDGELGGDDMKELQEIWIVLEQSAKWGSDLCDAAAEPGAIDYDPGILSPVLHFSYAASIFAQLAALKHLQRRGFDRNFALSYHRSSCLKNICRLVRDVRTPSSVNSLLSSTGTLWSVSSLVAFAELFCSSHAWDRELHPGGPGDKLASLNYLITTLSKVISMYRPTGSAATTTLRALEMDRVAIKSMLGLRTLANPSSSSNRLPPSPYTSLSEINNWLHRLDINPPDSSSSPPFAFSPPPRSSVAPSVPPYFASPARDGDETASSPLVPFPLPLPQSSSLHRPSSAAFPPASSSSRPSALSFPVQTIPSPSFPFGA
ncbi:hypothetical protein JCM8547_003068 [Rhodosporidiobolus lusitaniae]